MKVYVLGNPDVDIDSVPLKLLPKLEEKFPGINFIHFDPTEDIDIVDKHFIIIDTVLSLNKVTLFNDLNRWTISPRISLHDFDLPLFLGLLKKLGKVKKITIIGIPEKGNSKKMLLDVAKFLKDI